MDLEKARVSSSDKRTLWMLIQGTVFVVLLLLSVLGMVSYLQLSPIRTAATAAYAHYLQEERYITTVVAPILQPTSYAGVNLSFTYFYRKADMRLRVEVALPQGYTYASGDGTADSTSFIAYAVLPAWACHADPRGTDAGLSFYFQSMGVYGVDASHPTLEGEASPITIMTLSNDDFFIGYWDMRLPNASSLDTHDQLWIGASACNSNYDDDAQVCFPDVVGTMFTHFVAPIDQITWGLKFDAATPGIVPIQLSPE